MAKRTKTLSDAVTESRARTGAKALTMSLSPEENALLEKHAKAHGGKKAAVVAGLRALEARGEPTPEEALKVLARTIRRDRQN